MKKTLLVIGIIILCIGAFVGSLFFFTSGAVRAGDEFFLKIKEKDYSGAYALTTDALHGKISEDEFRAFLELVKFSECEEVSWGGRSVQTSAGAGTTGELTGTVKTTGGESIPVELILVKVDGVWEIDGIWKPGNKDESGDSPEIPSTEEAAALVMKTTLDFGTAVDANDLGLFYKTTSEDFQASVPLEKFVENFDVFLDKDLDFTVLKAVDPIFLNKPGLDKAGFLRLEGYLPDPTGQVNFVYQYVFRSGSWKILKLNISIGSPAESE